MLYRFAPRTRRADPPIDHDPGLQLPGAAPDRVLRGARRGGDHEIPPRPQLLRCRAHQQPTRPLAQHRSHLGQRPGERLSEPPYLCHSTTLEITNPEWDVIHRRALSEPDSDERPRSRPPRKKPGPSLGLGLPPGLDQQDLRNTRGDG